MGEGLSKYSAHYDEIGLDLSGSDCEDDKTPRRNRPTETVIIFDWDDTLLCSSAINAQEWSQQQLAELEEAAETVLHTAMELGETLIVTNGNEYWVQESTRLFLPRLQPTLNRLKVMSARAHYERRFPNEPFAWKRQAFKELLTNRREGSYTGHNPFLCGADAKTTLPVATSGKAPLNLVVLGDSRAEIEAAEHSVRILGGRSRAKTVKFKEIPTVNELLGQLRRVNKELEIIALEDGHSSRHLVPCSFTANMAQLTSWASGWKFEKIRPPQMQVSKVVTPTVAGSCGLIRDDTATEPVTVAVM